MVETSGHDLESALYNFLDEWLFNFCAEPFFVPFKIEINEFTRTGDGDDAIGIKSMGIGETFTLGRHPQGQASSLQSMRVAYSDRSTNPVRGFGSAKPVLHGTNSTEPNLFQHGEATYRVG